MSIVKEKNLMDKKLESDKLMKFKSSLVFHPAMDQDFMLPG